MNDTMTTTWAGAVVQRQNPTTGTPEYWTGDSWGTLERAAQYSGMHTASADAATCGATAMPCTFSLTLAVELA